MFNSKKCNHCGKDLKRDWIACPYCGKKVEEKVDVYRRPFSVFFDIDDIDKEFERIDKMFGSEFFKFPRIDIKNPFKSGGISITIRSGTGIEPKVDVKTSGEYKKLEPELKRKFGIRGGATEVEEERIEKKKPIRIPKVTEEPETKIETFRNTQKIQIKLPDVKNEDDIEIKKLEQSIEVKAFADDKAYFKLIPIPPNVVITKKEFKHGILKIEAER